MPKIIHVAATNAGYRESLKAAMSSFDIGDVVVASPEGVEGTAAVRDSKPDILIVSTKIEPETVEHLQWYRDAAPEAYIIGFAFSEDEARGLKDANINTVVSSKISRAKMIEVLQAVDRKTD